MKTIQSTSSRKIHLVAAEPGGYVALTKCGKLLGLDGATTSSLEQGEIPKEGARKCKRCFTKE